MFQPGSSHPLTAAPTIEDAYGYLEQVRESLGVERHGRLVQLINDYGRAAIQIEEVMEAVVPILGEDNDAITGFRRFVVGREHASGDEHVVKPSAPDHITANDQDLITRATRYVAAIQDRFDDEEEEQETLTVFLELLRALEGRRITCDSVLSSVAELFEGHPDLIQELHSFVPNTDWQQHSSSQEKVKAAKRAVRETEEVPQIRRVSKRLKIAHTKEASQGSLQANAA